MTTSKAHDEHRRYERIEAAWPCRVFIPEGDDEEDLKFEAFLKTRNAGLGGVFVESSFLLSTGLELSLDLELPGETLRVLGKVAHVVDLGDGEYPSGFGIEFLEVDAAGRETLMRDFAPPRYGRYYDSLLEEMPHIGEGTSFQDICLILNLWEEWKVVDDGGPLATQSGAPMPSPLRKKERKRKR